MGSGPKKERELHPDGHSAKDNAGFFPGATAVKSRPRLQLQIAEKSSTARREAKAVLVKNDAPPAQEFPSIDFDSGWDTREGLVGFDEQMFGAKQQVPGEGKATKERMSPGIAGFMPSTRPRWRHIEE